MAIKRTLLPLMLLASCPGLDFRPPVAVTPAAWLTGHPPPTPVEHSVALAEPISPGVVVAVQRRRAHPTGQSGRGTKSGCADRDHPAGRICARNGARSPRSCSPRWTATRCTRGKSPAPRAFSAPSAPPPRPVSRPAPAPAHRPAGPVPVPAQAGSAAPASRHWICIRRDSMRPGNFICGAACAVRWNWPTRQHRCLGGGAARHAVETTWPSWCGTMFSCAACRRTWRSRATASRSGNSF